MDDTNVPAPGQLLPGDPDDTGGRSAPVQTMSFGGLTISFDERVLQPRPWTAAQSAWAAELATSAPEGPILELCCGAGQIGLAASTATGRALHQVDVSPVACTHARHNAANAGVAATVLTAALEAVVLPRDAYPLILADPPYLAPAEVLRYPDDPVLAVDGGADGLDVIRLCLEVIERVLDPCGTALLQVRGSEQADGVAALPICSAGSLRAGELREYGEERAILALRRREPTEPPSGSVGGPT